MRDLCFFRTCGIRHVIGAPLQRDLRRPRIDPGTGQIEQEANRLARCLASLGEIDLDDRSFWDLRLQPDEIAAADKCLAPLGGERFVAINVGGKVQSKDWGIENWIVLLRLIAKSNPSFAMVFIGSTDEFERAAKIAASWPGQTLNLCGGLAPRESAAAMKRAMFFIGHDSGPMHLAAAVGTPCVGLFGNFNMPKWWHPNGKGHHIIHNMRGVREVSPDEVYAAVCATIAEADAGLQNAKSGIIPQMLLQHAK